MIRSIVVITLAAMCATGFSNTVKGLDTDGGPIVVSSILPGATKQVVVTATTATAINVPRSTGDQRADAYPAVFNVSGAGSRLIDIRLSMTVTHPWTRDINLLLESPNGRTAAILNFPNNAQSQNTQTSDTIIITDKSLHPYVEGSLDNASQVIRSTSESATIVPYPAPAPVGPHAENMTTFTGINPNGQWKLWARDGLPTFDNGVLGDLKLTIETADCNCTIPATGTGPGQAAIYPITLTVPEIGGGPTVDKLRVRFENISHTFPGDVEILLVSPTGKKQVLLADQLSDSDFVDSDVIIDPSGYRADNSITGNPSFNSVRAGFVFRPSAVSSLGLPAPAPPAPYDTNVNAMKGEPVSGTWKIYINDDASVDVGCLEEVKLEFYTNQESALTEVEQFPAFNAIEAAGSANNWSAFGSSTAGISGDDEFFVQILAHPTQQRTGGFIRNRDGWVTFDGKSIARANFDVYASGQNTPSDNNEIPNLRLRLQQRFAANSMLEVFHHSVDNAAQQALEQELRPSKVQAKPSKYQVEIWPQEVFRATASGEGAQVAIEAFSTLPQDNGRINIRRITTQRLSKNRYPLGAEPTKTYRASASSAGSLSVFNPAAELGNFVLLFAANPNDPASVAPGEIGGIYNETTGSVFLSTAAELTTAGVRVVERNFNPEDGNTAFTSRVRVGPNSAYAARFYVTSTRETRIQSQLRFRARSIKFAWSQKYEIGGPFAAGATSNNIARQILPGIGNITDDEQTTQVGLRGGIYTLLMPTPMDPLIRNEFASGASLATRMPNISVQPGEGVASSSRRDLFVGADVFDTLSTSTGFEAEGGDLRIEHIEVTRFPKF